MPRKADEGEGGRADDGNTELAAARSEAGTGDSFCIILGSGLLPALPSLSIPHVLGTMPSLDVMVKTGVLA